MERKENNLLLDINKIYCAECVKFMSKNIPDNYIDLIITSPPYDNLRKYQGYEFNFESVANQLYRIIKPGGIVVWIVGDKTDKGTETGTSFKQVLYFKDIGFNIHDTMIYKKDNAIPLNHNRYEQEFEFMFVLTKGTPKTFNPIMIPCKTAGAVYNYQNRNSASSKEKNHAVRTRNERLFTKDTKIKGNIWNYITGRNKSTKDVIAFKHPAIFPDKLAKDHILSWSNPGDLILDPMCGSGTTCKMAKLHSRNFIGIDIANEYVEIANQRIKNILKEW